MIQAILKLVVKLIWNALPIVALILGGIWLYNVVSNPGSQASSVATVNARPAVLEAIKQVNKQIFIEHYNMVDIQYTEAPEGWLSALGIKQEFVVLVRGQVPAGFDLQQLSEEDVWISADGSRIQLTLPAPIVFEDNVSVDFENSRVLTQSDSCPNFICDDTLEAYQNNALPEAKPLLIAAAEENGILTQAANDGKAYYEQFLKSLGFEEVRVYIDGYE